MRVGGKGAMTSALGRTSGFVHYFYLLSLGTVGSC